MALTRNTDKLNDKIKRAKKPWNKTYLNTWRNREEIKES